MPDAFSSRAFREALSSFATGVTVVTTLDANGQPAGMTASSFNSVSMEPPLVLWSIRKASASAEAFSRCEYFAVHVLAADQAELSARFATPGDDKFAGLTPARSARGVPILDDVAARFECRTWSVYEGGDHWIIVGKVETLDFSTAQGLVFASGSYVTASAISSTARETSAGETNDSPADGLLLYNLARAYRQLSDRFHETVRAHGLSVQDWRILASLHGETVREINDLAARTFIDRDALSDKVHLMQDKGLCLVDRRDDSMFVSGTAHGDECVRDLFELCTRQAKTAMGAAGEQGVNALIEMLSTVIDNTDDLHS